MEHVVELMKEKNWALMDIEYIRTSKTHRCIRKLYILAKDGFNDVDLDFYPCVRYKDMPSGYRCCFRFCRNHIHKLSYYPKVYASPCNTALEKIRMFIVDNDIDFILYKGGTIEKDLCDVLNMPSYNIECFRKLEKANSHDPRVEVNCYYGQLLRY